MSSQIEMAQFENVALNKNERNGDVGGGFDNNKSYERARADSTETLDSNIFPWKKITSRRRMVVPRNETGRQITPTSFFLCLLAVLLMCSGILLTCACVWAILAKLPYSHILNKSFVGDTNNFCLFGGILGVPCFWIAWTSHENKKSYLFLPLLMVLLGFSLSLLLTGTTITIIHRSKMYFTNTSNPTLLPSNYKILLNDAMVSGMSHYQDNYNHKYSWDKVQRKLKCCGVNSYKDWKEVPTSCYKEDKTIYKNGCLNGIAYELAWQMCLLTGCALITFGIQGITLLFVTYLYLKKKLSGRFSNVVIA